MAKKNGGLFGGLFDFNGDGKTDPGKEFIAYMIFEECVKGKDDRNRNGSGEIEGWEKEIAEYIDQTEQQSDKYAYSRRYAWRKIVPNGEKYNLDPLYYKSEQKYIEALRERKYGWREWYKGRDTLGLNVGDFETQEDFREAFNAQMAEKRQNEREKREAERLQRQKKASLTEKRI